MTARAPESFVRRFTGRELTPSRIAALYAVFGLALLVGSDLLLPLWLSGSTLREIQGLKGALEVLASAALIYVLVASAQRELRLKDRAMDEVPVGITIADARRADDPIVYVNEGFEAITGYDDAEARGRSHGFLLDEYSTTDAAEAERPAAAELLTYRKDGTPFWNRVSVVPIDDESGETTHLLTVHRDVTASTERKQRLAVLNRILRHNVRNKLNVIRGRLEQLDAVAEGTDAADVDANRVSANADPDADHASAETADVDHASGDAADARRAIREATDDLLAIADQIREFDEVLDSGNARSAIDRVDEHTSPNGEESFHRIDLAALVRETATAVRDRYSAATFDVETPENAPVRAHATLEPALETLLELAIEDTTAAATVRVTDEDDAVVVAVQDNDGSIPAMDLDVVARGTETPLEHLLGLDLWLVRWATEQSHGEFSVDKSGDAPVVRLRFPRTPAERQDSDAGSPTGE